MDNVNEVLRRLGAIESCVSDIRMQVSTMTAVMPCRDTRADTLAARSDLRSMETRIIKWIVASAAVNSTTAFVIARFVS